MIQANELRLGNKLTDEFATEYVVVEIKRNHVRCDYIRKDTGLPHSSIVDIKNVKGIPLTRDLIDKCGFRLASYSEWHSGILAAERIDYIYVEEIFSNEDDNNVCLDVICDIKTDAIRRV